ncbi:MAG TPA: PIN domain-containing protein [Tepidisphaeraceae bacterium]|jgi:hypothetical protein|nr:PIN domain-containing protein [Tepidisphaeraceae bacterium]
MIFADAFYYFALLNPADPFHERAARLTDRIDVEIVTTHYVLLEVADGLAQARNRIVFRRLMETLTVNRKARVIAADAELFEAATHLFFRRQDKDWSLTDCTSFLVMERLKITDALTADHHFEQAGFRALLKPQSRLHIPCMRGFTNKLSCPGTTRSAIS